MHQPLRCTISLAGQTLLVNDCNVLTPKDDPQAKALRAWGATPFFVSVHSGAQGMTRSSGGPMMQKMAARCDAACRPKTAAFACRREDRPQARPVHVEPRPVCELLAGPLPNCHKHLPPAPLAGNKVAHCSAFQQVVLPQLEPTVRVMFVQLLID